MTLVLGRSCWALIGLVLSIAVQAGATQANSTQTDTTPPVVAELRWSNTAVGTLYGLVYDNESGIADVALVGPRGERCPATRLYASHIRVVCPATLTNPSQWRLEVLDYAGNRTRQRVP